MNEGDPNGDGEKGGGEVGYRRPPASTRYRKGQSGNPKGRPKNRHAVAPHEAVLGQMVTIREGGAERRVTAAEALVLRLTQRGLEGNGPAARDIMTLIEVARHTKVATSPGPDTIILSFVRPGSVNSALESLRMAKKLDPYRDTARMRLEPWLVQMALARLGNRRLSREEQEVVVKATRTPHKVTWPDWWVVKK